MSYIFFQIVDIVQANNLWLFLLNVYSVCPNWIIKHAYLNGLSPLQFSYIALQVRLILVNQFIVNGSFLYTALQKFGNALEMGF